MKAILLSQYGSPDVLQLKEVEKPSPNDGEILVRIHAASANPLDWHRMRASPFFVRFGDGLRKPKDPRLGADIAGRVKPLATTSPSFSQEMRYSGHGRIVLPSTHLFLKTQWR